MARRNLSIWPDYTENKTTRGLADATENLVGAMSKYGAVDTPVVFPSQSGAWQYYARQLETGMPMLSKRNTDYIKFTYREYAILTPPEGARIDSSTPKEFFGTTPEWWGDKEKDSLAQEVPRFSQATGTHAQKLGRVTQQGGERMSARFTADNGTSYVMGPQDRLWMARLLFGELRIHSNKAFDARGGFDSNSEISMHAWMIMNLLMTRGRGGSLARLAMKYSEALQAKTGSSKDFEQYRIWKRAKEAYKQAGKAGKELKKLKRKFFQAKNQYMANVAIWPGAEEFYSQGAYLGPGGKSVVIPTKLAEFVNKFAAGEILKPDKVPGKILDTEDPNIKWGSGSTYGLKIYDKSGEVIKWNKGKSADGFPYTDLAPPGFSFRKKIEGNWRGLAFRPQKPSGKGVSGNMYVRRKNVSESTLRSIRGEKINTRIYADGIPVEPAGISKRALFGTNLESLTEYQGQTIQSETEKQPGNDQQEETSEMPSEEAEGTPIKKAQEASERQQNRADWINSLAREGRWRYEGLVEEREVFKNLFSRPIIIEVGGKDQGATSLQNIVPVAASVQFGHRLAEHKLVGHKTSTWQFLGAGNKSGTIVLSAAGEAGRQALQQIKSMYSTLNYNARHMGDIREASSAKVDVVSPEGSKNNIFALLGIEHISIANVSDESFSQEGVDIYQMTLEFLVQEFPEFTFSPRGAITQELKNKIAGKIIDSLSVIQLSQIARDPSRKNKSVEGEKTGVLSLLAGYLTPDVEALLTKAKLIINQVGDFSTSASELKAEALLFEAAERASLLQRKRLRHQVIYKPQDIPWYDDLLSDVAISLTSMARSMPVMSIPFGYKETGWVDVKNAFSGRVPEETWEDRFREFGNQLGGQGERLLDLIGGKGTKLKKNGRGVRGYVIPGEPADGDRYLAQKLQFLQEVLNKAVDQAMRKAEDKEKFTQLFGKDVYNEIIEVVVSEYGSCYPDLKLPEVPGTKIKTTPEFYLYDDSQESPIVSQVTDHTDIMSEYIRRHLNNSANSLVRFIARGGSLKLQASKNTLELNAIRKKHSEADRSEAQYLGEEGGFANPPDSNPVTEGAQVRDAITYKSDLSVVDPASPGPPSVKRFNDSALGKANTELWNTITALFGSENKTNEAFLSMVAASSSLNLDESMTETDKKTLINHTRDFFFKDLGGRLPEQLYIGPDGEQASVDEVLDGEVETNNTTDDTTLTGDAQPASAPDGAAIGGAGLEAQQSSDEWGDDYYSPEDAAPQTIDPEVAKSIEEREGKYRRLYERAKKIQASKELANTIKTRMKKDFSLRRAFPTFKIFFIDEDSSQGIGDFRAFDDFYSYSAVQEIRITESKDNAASLAVIRITDVAHKLTRQRFSNVEMTEDELQTEDPLGWRAETRKENPFNDDVLRAGVMVQIRLGYSPEPDQLETRFLGQIVEIAPSEGGKILEIVCQGYGAELEAAPAQDLESPITVYSPQHALCTAIFQPHVRHFGRWSPNELYNPAQIRRKYVEVMSRGLGTIDVSMALFDAKRREFFYQMTKLGVFVQKPQDDNIFAPPPQSYGGHELWTRFWDNANSYSPFFQTPWEVFKEHELRHPGYVSLPMPYGHDPRMTVFFGLRGQRYWSKPCSKAEHSLATYWMRLMQSIRLGEEGTTASFLKRGGQGLKALKKINPDLYTAVAKTIIQGQENATGEYFGRAFGRYKPFQNHFIATSDHHILKNNIRTNTSHAFNSVSIKYSEDESTTEADDIEEMNEAQKEVKEGGEGVFTAKLNDNLPDWQIRTYEDSYPSCVTSFMAKRYAGALLAEGVRKSYSGELTIVGEEKIKQQKVNFYAKVL